MYFFSDQGEKTSRDEIKKWCAPQQNLIDILDLGKMYFLNYFSDHIRRSSLDEIKKWCPPEQYAFETIDLNKLWFWIYWMITTEIFTWWDKKMMSAWAKHLCINRFKKNVVLDLFADHNRKTSRDEIKKWYPRKQITYEAIDL